MVKYMLGFVLEYFIKVFVPDAGQLIIELISNMH